MPDLNIAVPAWLEWLIPRKPKKGWYDYRSSEPQFVANLLNVDRLRQIIASAETGNTRDLFGLYRDVILSDSHVQAEFGKRKLAVLGDAVSIQPWDKKQPADVQAADFIKDQFADLIGFTVACGHLLDGTLYPLSLLEKVYKPSLRPGIRYDLGALNIVQANDIDFTTGFLKLRGLDQHTGAMTGQLEDAEATRYIIHKGHLLSTADYWGGPMRSILFWWLLRSMSRDWWARFLDRYGAPFLVGKYDESDDYSRIILSQAFNAATKIFGLVVTNETEVELVQAAAGQTGEAFDRFQEKCNDEISKLIVGQTGSAKQMASGLNSGGNKQHENVRQDIRQFDGKMLGDTIREQLFRQLLSINGFTGRAPKIVWGGLSPEAQTTLGGMVVDLAQAQLSPTDEALDTIGEQIGFSLQRVVAPTPPPMHPAGQPPQGFSSHLLPLSTSEQEGANRIHAMVDRLARGAAPDLSQAFRGSLAPIRRIILESGSAQECETRIREFYADWKPDRVTGLVEEALTAYVANGSVAQAIVKR